MKTQTAIETLDEMQKQIIHGKRTFGDIADIIRDAETALNAAGVAVGSDGKMYTLAERIEWLVRVKEYFVRQTDELREKSSNAKLRDAGESGVEQT